MIKMHFDLPVELWIDILKHVSDHLFLSCLYHVDKLMLFLALVGTSCKFKKSQSMLSLVEGALHAFTILSAEFKRQR